MVGDIIRVCFELAGALALFMYGMHLSSEGIQRAAGDRLQGAVNFMTRNTVMATLTGMLITILIQSSSATSVMMVSFVNSGLLGLQQSIGVMLGSNIGTTLTGWLVAAAGIKKFKIVALAVPIFGLGFFMSLMKKRGTTFTSYGEALMGFALLFLGLEFMGNAIPEPSADMLLKLKAFEGRGWVAILAGIGVGCVFTMLINASSATIAVTIGFAAKGIIGYDMAAAIVLGANIGTTFDSFLASIGTNTAAKRSAWGNIIFNIAGALLIAALFRPFSALVDWMTPGAYSEATAAAHIAMYHTVFNVVTSLSLLPFAKAYARMLCWLIKDREGEVETRRKLAYSAGPVTEIPELNLFHARKEIGRMAGVARGMFSRFRGDVKEQPSDIVAEVEWFREEETYADRMQEELAHFLLEVSRQSPAEKTQANIQHMLRVVDELENITDSCMSLALLLQRCRNKGLVLDKEELESLAPYTLIADEFLRFVEENADEHIDEAELALAAEFEQKLDDFRSSLKKKARKRLKAGADVKTELLFIDLVRHVEKIGDYAFSISESLREMR